MIFFILIFYRFLHLLYNVSCAFILVSKNNTIIITIAPNYYTFNSSITHYLLTSFNYQRVINLEFINLQLVLFVINLVQTIKHSFFKVKY